MPLATLRGCTSLLLALVCRFAQQREVHPVGAVQVGPKLRCGALWQVQILFCYRIQCRYRVHIFQLRTLLHSVADHQLGFSQMRRAGHIADQPAGA